MIEVVKKVELRAIVDVVSTNTRYCVMENLTRTDWTIEKIADLWFEDRGYRIEGGEAISLDGQERLSLVEQLILEDKK